MYEDASVYKKYAIKRRDTKNIAATLKEARPMLEVELKSLLKVRPKVKRIVGLTGTPSSNGLMDLWAEFRTPSPD